MTTRGVRLRWLKWALLIGGLGLMVVATILWLMFQHIPSWYRPIAVVPRSDADQRVKDDWVGAKNSFEEHLLHGNGPFEFAIRQDRLNAWLGARECSWQRSREWLPPSLSDPFVLIERDGLRVAATYHSGGLKTVISARLHAILRPEGVRIALDEVAGGSLGVPNSLVRRWLAALDGSAWPVGSRSPYQLGGPPLPPLAGLFEGVIFPDRWIWANARAPFQIVGLRCEPGELTFILEPLSH